MITVSELRVGNLVLNEDGIIHEIHGIDSISITSRKPNIAEPFENAHIHRYVPVSLTEERLVNFGFVKVKAISGVICAYKKGGIRINISNSGNFYWKNKPVPYVHLLQNIYYFNELTGEELKIN